VVELPLIFTLGVSHKTAPVDIRERLAFSPEHIPSALKMLAERVAVDEVAILSTCNRTEFYCSATSILTSHHAILSWWQHNHQMTFEVEPYLYMYSEESAVKHVMRVASGLDSMVIGEPQILGQLKSAFQLANGTGTLGKNLFRLFQSSFSVAKQVRTKTSISQHPVSVAFAAVALARKIFTDLSQVTVVLIGAGENIELTLKHLVAKTIKEIRIVNRTQSHAQALAAQYGAKSYALEDLPRALQGVDIVISSIDCPKVLTEQHVCDVFQTSRRRPIFMVDLGVPRNISPEIATHEDIYLYTIDDLQGIIKENLQHRAGAATEAETLIIAAANEYMHWVQAQQSLPIIKNIRSQAEHIKQDSIHLALRQLDNGVEPKKVIEHLAHRLTQKLMHQSTLELKQTHAFPTREMQLEELSTEYESID